MGERLDWESVSGAIGTDNEVPIEDLTSVLAVFKKLSSTGRLRLLDTIATFFAVRNQAADNHLNTDQSSSAASSVESPGRSTFSEDRSMSPKEFVLQKHPQTDVERVACLAYYLTHYRDAPQFKTLDISKVNTEAAQPKFSNAAFSVNNAVKTGYLISVAKGNRQLERFRRAICASASGSGCR